MNGQHFPPPPMSIGAFAQRGLIIVLFMATVTLTSGCSTITAVFGMEATAQETSANANTYRTLMPTPMPIAVEGNNKNEGNSDESKSRDGNNNSNKNAKDANDANDENNGSDNNNEAANHQEASTAIAMAKPSNLASSTKGVSLVVTGDSVNVRNGPGLDAAILTAVPKGTIIEMLGKNGAGDWYEVCCVQSQSGWIFAQLVKIQEGGAPPAAPKPVTAQESAVTTSTTSSISTISNNSQAAPETANRVQPAAVNPDWSRYEYYEKGLAISLPSTWKPQNWDSEAWQAGLDLLVKENGDLAKLLDEQSAVSSDTKLEIIAFDVSPTVLEFGFATNVNVVKQYMLEGMSLDLFTRLAIREIKKTLKPEEVAREQVQIGNGEAALVQYELSMTPTNSSSDPIKLMVVQYLLTNEHTGYIITFTTPASQLNEYASTFEQIAGSFEVLE